MQNKLGRGGSRTGAGRKAKPITEKALNRTMKLTEKDFNDFKALGGVKWLRENIDTYAEVLPYITELCDELKDLNEIIDLRYGSFNSTYHEDSWCEITKAIMLKIICENENYLQKCSNHVIEKFNSLNFQVQHVSHSTDIFSKLPVAFFTIEWE